MIVTIYIMHIVNLKYEYIKKLYLNISISYDPNFMENTMVFDFLHLFSFYFYLFIYLLNG